MSDALWPYSCWFCRINRATKWQLILYDDSDDCTSQYWCVVQAGKHEAIVKNVHELLAKLAWDFSPQQLDHLFECFQVEQSRY